MNKNRHQMAVAAHLWLFDVQGRSLFLRRANTGYADGQWSVPAGHVEQGETIAEACVREAHEEIGIVLAPEELRFSLVQHKRDFDGEERIDVFFAANLPTGQTATIREPTYCDGLTWSEPGHAPDPLVEYIASALAHRDDGHSNLIYWGFDEK